MSRALRWLAIGMLVCAGAAEAGELSLTKVYHEPRAIRPGEATAAVRFRLSRRAEVSLHVFDHRDLLIRSVRSAGQLQPGARHLVWDGKDSRGRRVPPEAYRYTLEARADNGEAVYWDISDHTGGERLEVKNVRWDSEVSLLHYLLDKPARVRARVGIDNGGPLLRSLLDWVPRTSGAHQEAWDGRDASDVLDLSRHPALKFQLSAFRLSANTILVEPPAHQVQLIEGLPEPLIRRERRKMPTKRMRDYGSRPLEKLRDLPVAISLPSDLVRGKDDLPVVSSPLAVTVHVAKADEARLLDDRFEAAFFVDGRYAFETEVGFLPMTWTWDPQGVNEGEHYITVNLLGYEGAAGISTVKLFVAPPRASGPAEKKEERAP